MNAGLFLTHLIQSGWIKNLQTSTLAFDIAQVFLSLNHHLIPLILRKTGCDLKISNFFSDYLVDRKTCYSWNGFMLPFFSTNEGIGQGLAFLPILLAFFIILIFHIFEKRIKNINIPIFFLLFVDDGLFISQEKSFIYLNTNPFCSYNIMITLLDQFGLVVKHEKTEVFYFSRSIGAFDLLALDLSQISRPILYSKDI